MNTIYKNTLRCFLAGLTGLVLLSCEGFLEEDTSSFLSDQVVYETDGSESLSHICMCDYEYFPSGYPAGVCIFRRTLYQPLFIERFKMEALPSTNT